MRLCPGAAGSLRWFRVSRPRGNRYGSAPAFTARQPRLGGTFVRQIIAALLGITLLAAAGCSPETVEQTAVSPAVPPTTVAPPSTAAGTLACPGRQALSGDRQAVQRCPGAAGAGIQRGQTARRIAGALARRGDRERHADGRVARNLVAHGAATADAEACGGIRRGPAVLAAGDHGRHAGRAGPFAGHGIAARRLRRGQPDPPRPRARRLRRRRLHLLSWTTREQPSRMRAVLPSSRGPSGGRCWALSMSRKAISSAPAPLRLTTTLVVLGRRPAVAGGDQPVDQRGERAADRHEPQPVRPGCLRVG